MANYLSNFESLLPHFSFFLLEDLFRGTVFISLIVHDEGVALKNFLDGEIIIGVVVVKVIGCVWLIIDCSR